MSSYSAFASPFLLRKNGSQPAATDGAACRLVGLLGEGGMARVYLAHHEGLNRQVAVKRLRPQLAHVPAARERLLAEADLVRTVRHDHVVDVLDVVSDPDDSYFVMEHVAGEPLSDRLARSGALPMSELLAIAQQVAAALEAVHRRGIVHRDLKTENVLVNPGHTGGMCAKLIDFGVAEILGDSGHLQPVATAVGTPESMAPEQAIGDTVDQRCDIYSFGVLLYEMLTGAPPFRDEAGDVTRLLERVATEVPVPPGRTEGGQRQHIPQALEALVIDCLAKRPGRRPQTMAEVRARLAQVAQEYGDLSAAVDRALGQDDDDHETIATAELYQPTIELVHRRMPDASQRLGRFAGAALFVTAVAAGLLGLFGGMAWWPEGSIPWIR
jgi:serine/threonine-protein kinase